jgi:hypothetical protein
LTRRFPRKNKLKKSQPASVDAGWRFSGLSRTAAGCGGRGLGFFFFRFLDFFFLTAVAFGHNDLLVNVERQLRRFPAVLQVPFLK